MVRRWQMMWKITLQSIILPTIIIMLIIRIQEHAPGFEMIILLYQPATYGIHL
jgi:putative aldouronate transport system permease protein